MTADQVGHRLADAQIDYDILPQDVFEHRDLFNTCISDGQFRVNTQFYRAFVIPYSQFITAPLADAIEELKSAGIPVLYINGIPEGICKEFRVCSIFVARFSGRRTSPSTNPRKNRLKGTTQKEKRC